MDDRRYPVGIATTERDISARVKEDLRLSFENRALKALNAWYERFGEAPSISLREVCELLIRETGYRMTWIGQVEDGQPNQILPVAWAGFRDIQSAPQTQAQILADQSRQQIQTALQNRRPVAIRNIHKDLSQKLWHPDARKNEYNAYMALPLLLKKDPLGVLFIYAAEPEAFI